MEGTGGVKSSGAPGVLWRMELEQCGPGSQPMELLLHCSLKLVPSGGSCAGWSVEWLRHREWVRLTQCET